MFMKNTIFNYFGVKNTSNTCSSVVADNSSSNENNTSTQSTSPITNDEVIFISSDEESDLVPTKRRKSLKVKKATNALFVESKRIVPL